MLNLCSRTKRRSSEAWCLCSLRMAYSARGLPFICIAVACFFFGGGQSQRTLSPLFVEDFEERVEVPAAASALHGVAFAFGMLF